MYSIVDIESSGGKYGEEKIIEIGIYKFDGKEIVDSFSTLVNPEKPIDEYVQKLTGITQNMIKRSPKFHEIAKRIVKITENTTLVAHNAAFDYRMLKQEFQELGFSFSKNTLDTLLLSKYLLPNEESYSLEKLCKGLNIPILNAHRAFGDAQATVELFKLLLEKDVEKNIIEKSIQNKIYGKFSPRIVEMLEELPHQTGVFYLHNTNGNIIYVGYSGDIYQKVHSLFTQQNSLLAEKIQTKTDKISYDICGSLLWAELKYHEERMVLKPSLNKLEKQRKMVYAKKEFPENNMLWFEKGRTTGEKFYFLIRNGMFMGGGYFNLQSQIDTEDKLLKRLIPIKQTPLIKSIILHHQNKKQFSQNNKA